MILEQSTDQKMRTLTAFVDPDRASEKIEDQVEAMIGTHSVEGDESVFAL